MNTTRVPVSCHPRIDSDTEIHTINTVDDRGYLMEDVLNGFDIEVGCLISGRRLRVRVSLAGLRFEQARDYVVERVAGCFQAIQALPILRRDANGFRCLPRHAHGYRARKDKALPTGTTVNRVDHANLGYSGTTGNFGTLISHCGRVCNG